TAIVASAATGRSEARSQRSRPREPGPDLAAGGPSRLAPRDGLAVVTDMPYYYNALRQDGLPAGAAIRGRGRGDQVRATIQSRRASKCYDTGSSAGHFSGRCRSLTGRGGTT